MMFIVKPAACAVLAYSVAAMPRLVNPVSLLAPLLLILMALQCRIRAGELIRKNIVFMSFIISLAVLQILSGIVHDGIRWDRIVLISFKSIMIFNIACLSGAWIGRGGMMDMVSAVPGQRVKLFLILFYRTVKTFLRTSRMILFQVRSRMDLTVRTRLMLAQYYVRNLLVKELYSYHFHQAALYTRLPGRIMFSACPQRITIHEALLAALIAAACAAAIIIPG